MTLMRLARSRTLDDTWSCTATVNVRQGQSSPKAISNLAKLGLCVPNKPLLCLRNSQTVQSNGVNVHKISHMNLFKKRKNDIIWFL